MAGMRRVAWVTGAGSGIGAAAAVALARSGHAVALTGRRRDALERVAGEISAAGGEAMVAPGDVTDSAAMAAIAEAIVGAHGRIDVLVNNAGMNLAERSFAELTADAVDQLIGTNLSSAFYGVLAVLPAMRAQGGGLVIHVSSWAGRYPTVVSGPAYSAAKSGLALMSSLLNEEESGAGIRSTVVYPAETATPILDRRRVKATAEQRARMLQPDDLGRLIAFLADQPAGMCVNEVVVSPTANGLFRGVAVPVAQGGT